MHIYLLMEDSMALSNLADWNQTKASPEKGAACGTACGSGKPEKKPAACGAEKPEKKPAACGSACGAGKPEKTPEKKPAACGSACGAGGK